MPNTIGVLIKNFERKHNICIDAHDAVYYWIVQAWTPAALHLRDRKSFAGAYVSGAAEQGYVLILNHPGSTTRYTVEYWGLMDSFELFIRKAMIRTLDDRAEREALAGPGSASSGRPARLLPQVTGQVAGPGPEN